MFTVEQEMDERNLVISVLSLPIKAAKGSK